MQDISIDELLEQARTGDHASTEKLIAELHKEMRQMASAMMRKERDGHTLQTTALLNEVYLRLVKIPDADWQVKEHFFAAAATAMRRILVEHARARTRKKRGGGWERIPLDGIAIEKPEPIFELLALDEAMNKLEQLDAPKVRLVELRYHAGLTIEETAEVLGVSPSTVKREWQLAKAWLFRELQAGSEA